MFESETVQPVSQEYITPEVEQGDEYIRNLGDLRDAMNEQLYMIESRFIDIESQLRFMHRGHDRVYDELALLKKETELLKKEIELLRKERA